MGQTHAVTPSENSGDFGKWLLLAAYGHLQALLTLEEVCISGERSRHLWILTGQLTTQMLP